METERRKLEDSSGACGVADIAGATGVGVSGRSKRQRNFTGAGSGSGEDSGGGRVSQSAKTGPPLQTEAMRATAAGTML